jgi:hypothetical protein
MEAKTRLILLEILLIFFLICSIWAIDSRINQFKRDCVGTFDINDSCPCIPKQISFINDNDFNLSKLILNNVSTKQ